MTARNSALECNVKVTIRLCGMRLFSAPAQVNVIKAIASLSPDGVRAVCSYLGDLASHQLDCYYDDRDVANEERAKALALAIEQGDGKAAADHAHRLCMDLAGVPVMREIHIGRAPWERAA